MSRKITEKEVAQSILDSAYVLITQQEDDGSGQKVESLRRISLSVFLKKCGTNTGSGDGDVDPEAVKQIVDEYLAANPPSGGVSFITDETLTLKDGVLSVNTTDVVEEDNTMPVTSAAVHTVVGNISAILDTI